MDAVFESENILYIHITERLVKDYLAMVNDYEHVGRMIGKSKGSVISEEDERAWIQKKLARGDAIFSMIEKKSGDFIGNVELMHPDGSSGELGISITAAKQDRGFGTEAVQAMTVWCFSHPELKRIFLRVFPDNARAIRVYENCGFRRCGQTEKDLLMEIFKQGAQ